MSTGGSKGNRLLEIDALRGVAAFGVLLFHYSYQFQEKYHPLDEVPYTFDMGKYGVHLFFVISGFVIFWTLEKTRRPGDFVVSRFSRLFPAYWASLVITLGLIGIAGLPGQRVSTVDALLNFTMFPDFLRATPVDGSYWTLQVELFFYVQMLGWFMVGGLSRIRWIIVGWLLAATAFALASKFGHPLSYTVRELLIIRYVPFFAAGILLYRMREPGGRTVQDWALMAAAIAASWVVWGWPEALSIAFCVVVFRMIDAGMLGFLTHQPLLFLGSISYTLYLLHQEIGYILIDAFEDHGISAALSIVLTTVLMIVLAWLLSITIEKPGMHYLRSLYKKWRDTPSNPIPGGSH